MSLTEYYLPERERSRFWMFAVVAIFSFFCGVKAASDPHPQAAIDAGAAYYEVDPKTGETYFVYGCPATTPASGQ